MNLSAKILKAIQRGLYEGLSKYDLTVLDDEDSIVVKNNNYKHSSINDDLIEILPEFLDDDKAFKVIVKKIILLNKQYTVKDKEELESLVDKSIKIFGNECDLNWIDTSLITDMSYLFRNKPFNGHIENWDVSNVTNMDAMFGFAKSFNQPIGNWDTSNVKDMSFMFAEAELFNQPLDDWDVSNVNNMASMFQKADSFNQPLNNWDVSNVKNMSYMFYNVKSFNQSLNNWDTSNVTNMCSTFSFAESFNQPLNNWDVSNVKNMSYMFYNANSFNQDISNWNTSNVTIKLDIFSDCSIKSKYKPKFKKK